MERFLPTLRELLVTRRVEQDAKVQDVAYAAGVAEKTIYNFEKGRETNTTSWPRDTDEIVSAYAKAFNVQPVALWHEALMTAIAQREAGASRAKIPAPPGLAPSRSTRQPQRKSPPRKASGRRGDQP